MRPLKRCFGVALLTLLVTAAPCWAQFHIEVNYAKPNSANDREWLFGDWNGMRTQLVNKGVDFAFESTTDAMGVIHGGLSNEPAGWTRIRGTVDVNFDKLTGRKLGLSFHATALWQTGANIGDKLGSYANPSSIASVHVFRMDSFWLQKQFADGIVTLRAGQMAGWDFFGNQEYGGDYLVEPLGYAFGNMFDNTYLTYNPAGVPAAYVRIDGFRNSERPVHGIYTKAAVFSGNRNPYQQDPTGLHFVIANSPVIASEVGYVWDAPTSLEQRPPEDRKVYPGVYRFGGIVNYNGQFTNQLTGATTEGGYLYYFLAAQAVYRAEAGRNRGLDLTFGYDNSPNDINKQNSMVTVGGIYHGIVPGRSVDDLVFGFVSTRNGNAFSQLNQLLYADPLGWEKAYTVNYRAQVKPWLVVQPTVQYFAMIQGDPRRSSGLVIGLRVFVKM